MQLFTTAFRVYLLPVAFLRAAVVVMALSGYVTFFVSITHYLWSCKHYSLLTVFQELLHVVF